MTPALAAICARCGALPGDTEGCADGPPNATPDPCAGCGAPPLAPHHAECPELD